MYAEKVRGRFVGLGAVELVGGMMKATQGMGDMQNVGHTHELGNVRCTVWNRRRWLARRLKEKVG